MKRALIRTKVLASLAAGLLSSSALANTLYFQMNPNLAGGGDQRQVFIFGPPNATGTVTGGSGFSQAFDTGAEGFVVITLPLADQLASGSVQNLGFRVDSSAAVSGYYLSRRSATTDMAYLIDGARLGTDHFILGYQNIFEDQMSAQAIEDNTVVTFRPVGQAEFQVTLNAGQTYMHTSNSQLTGSRILSDKPIAVFSGNRCTNVPTGVTACDHIVEQMPSIDKLSSTYLLGQTVRTGTQGNVVRVVATADNTEIRFNGTLVATLNAGQFHEGRVVGGVEIVATNPVLVGQYLIGQSQAGENTDPAMTIVPGADQWLSSYVFATPSGAANFPTDFINIVIRTTDIASLTVNGVAPDPGLFNPLGSTLYSFANIDVSSTTGPFAITAANPFQLLLLGFDSFDSYFTYGGAAFAPGASPPPEPPTPGGVDVYWDGDAAGNFANGVVDGGDGVLTAVSVNLTVPDGSTNNTLPAEPANIIFQGAPGAVEIDTSAGAISVSGMRFRVDGYRIFGDELLVPGDAVFEVGDATPGTATFVALVESSLNGDGRIEKTGAGTLALAGTNGFSGGLTITEGTVLSAVAGLGTGAIANAGALIIDQPVAATFAAGISGTGTLAKRGAGTLALDGTNALSGTTSVEAGRLDVVGSLASSAVTTSLGGTLGGTGTVGSVTTLAGGRLAPGLSIGTLSVNGDITQNTGSIFEVETTSTGLADRVNATGTATIATGAILNVVKLDAPRFVLGRRYTILSAAGGRTGTFTLTGATRVSQFISVVGEYDATNAYLAVRQTSSFASVGGTPNQVAAATGVDNAGNGSVYEAIAYLPDAASARAAFDLVSGEIHASLRGIAFEDTRFVRDAVASRLQSAGDARRGFWMNGYGAWGDWDGDGNAADLSRNIAGVFFGVDAIANERLNVGILGGFGNAEFDVGDRRSEATARDFHLGAYAGFGAAGAGPEEQRAGGISGRVGIANMWRDLKTTRTPAFPGYAETLRSSYDLSVFQVFGDVGYRLDLGAVGVEPFAGIAYVRVSSSDFLESGGSGALRSAGDETSEYWMSSLGGRAYIGLPVGGGRLGFVATGAWRHDGGDVNDPLSMRFASGPAFDISGVPIAEDSALLGAAITGRIGARVEVEAGYSGQIGGGVSDHGVKANIIVRF